MTSSLAALVALLAATTEPATTPTAGRTIEIVIAGPEALRVKMEESLRPLIGDDPAVRWATRESAPAETPPLAVPPTGGTHILIDVASPTQLRVYLPGCSTSAAGNLRTVERPDGGEPDLVGRETVAQIVKAAVQVLRSDGPAAAVCEVGRRPETATATAAADPGPRRQRRMWLGMGSGIGWGYVPQGKLEWEKAITVQSQAGRAGTFHLLPEVGYMFSDDFAVAAQVRVQFIHQEMATYRDPQTGEIQMLGAGVAGRPETRAIAGLLRAIWYRDLSVKGDLRLSLSADAGGGFVRFPVKPTVVVRYDPSIDANLVDWAKTIAKTDTRPMGVLLLGGSAGLLWSLARHFAVALDVRVLSGLPDWGALVEGQVSAQVGL